jgi:hypothetical protein
MLWKNRYNKFFFYLKAGLEYLARIDKISILETVTSAESAADSEAKNEYSIINNIDQQMYKTVETCTHYFLSPTIVCFCFLSLIVSSS